MLDTPFRSVLNQHCASIDGLDMNIQKFLSLVMVQCTEIMQQKINDTDDFPDVEAAQDGLDMLKIIRDVSKTLNPPSF
jgi:hypothetical protein